MLILKVEAINPVYKFKHIVFEIPERKEDFEYIINSFLFKSSAKDWRIIGSSGFQSFNPEKFNLCEDKMDILLELNSLVKYYGDYILDILTNNQLTVNELSIYLDTFNHKEEAFVLFIDYLLKKDRFFLSNNDVKTLFNDMYVGLFNGYDELGKFEFNKNPISKFTKYESVDFYEYGKYLIQHKYILFGGKYDRYIFYKI